MKRILPQKFCWLFFMFDKMFRNVKIRPLLLLMCVCSISTVSSYSGEPEENGKEIITTYDNQTNTQEQISLSGNVTDANTNEPLPGVSILIEGSTMGTITGVDGKYSIEVPGSDAVLVFSFIGYVTQKVPLNEDLTQLDIQLVTDIEALEEVVVVGYGTMKKKDLTGSISQVRPSDIENENPNTVQDVLRGTPGLIVGFDPSAKGGGDILIRGQRSVYTDGGHNDPLIVLDGMIFYGELSEINPDDIEQIDVLKDASAAAVYGAKAANGVIIISTKRGKMGKPTINFNSSIGFVTMGTHRSVYGPEGYLQFYEDWYTTPTYGLNSETGNYEAYQTTRSTQPGYYTNPTSENLAKYNITLEEWRDYTNNPEGITDEEIFARRLGIRDKTLEGYLEGYTFDWFDQTFRNGVNQDYNISISGASDQMNYYMSLGYLSNEGIALGNDYSTIRSNLKVEGKVNKRLTIGANVNFQERSDLDLAVDWYRQILENSPYARYKDENGELVAHPMRDGGYAQGLNYDFDQQYRRLERGYIVLNSILSAKVSLPFNITYTFNYAPRFQFFHDRYHESAEHPDWAGTNGLVNREQARRFDWSLNNTINWDYTFADKHHVNLTLVQEAEELQYWQDRIEARDITPTDALGFHQTSNANKDKSSFWSNDTRETADGMLARLFYSFDDRYMITGSVRRDGYSAFGTSNPRATFYSAALAWTFTNERFIDWEVMNIGKIRFSWGQNGNRSLDDPYLALANLRKPLDGGTQGYVSSSGEYVQYQVLLVDRLANTHLQWEKTSAYNVGLDLGFLNNRLAATLDYFVMPTTDMIMNQSLPIISGFSSITTNLGEVENKGFEFLISSHNISKSNLQWNTTLSFTKYKNTIKHLYYRYEDVLDAEGNIIATKEVDDIDNGWFIGQPISAIWDYRVTGIWQADEVEEAERYGQRPGDPKVANNYTEDDTELPDGTTRPVYNNNDKEFLGQTDPPIFWSLRNDFTIYNYFELSINIYSFWGHKVLDGNYLNRDNNKSEVDNSFNVYEREYWTVENPSDKYGRLNANGPSGLASPYKLFDRSFIRLENIAVSFTVPDKYLTKLRIERLKIYGNIRNVAVWTKEWEYWDPETYDHYDDPNDPFDGPLKSGLSPRTYTIGLNVIF